MAKDYQGDTDHFTKALHLICGEKEGILSVSCLKYWALNYQAKVKMTKETYNEDSKLCRNYL